MATISQCSMDTLPNELFWKILILIRNTSHLGLSALTSLLLVCKRWHDVVLDLLYHDIRLTNSNLDSFIQNFARSNGPQVKSLTILIYSTFAPGSGLAERPPSTVEEAEDAKGEGSAETQRLWLRLQLLLEKIKEMTNLSMFSFVVAPDSLRDGFWIPSQIVGAMIDSLPASCQSLEVDTKGRDYPRPKSAHLCNAIRNLLPQLKYVRLHLRAMCQALFGTGPAPGPHRPFKNKFEYTSVDAPNLQVLLVNCLAGHLYRSQARICGPVQDYPFFSSPGSHGAQFVLARCMRAIVEHGKCPANARLSVFGAQPGNDHDKSVYPAFNRRDIVENVTYTQPFLHIDPSLDASYLIRTFGDEDILSTAGVIQDLAEGRTWQETTNGFRFPSDFLERQSGEMGYIIKQLPFLDAKAWKAKFPRNTCLLWMNEQKTRRRLLEAQKHDGILGTSLVKEETPMDE